jgi:hypothetical protein
MYVFIYALFYLDLVLGLVLFAKLHNCQAIGNRH